MTRGLVITATSARIFKCLWGPGIDSKEWIPPAYVAWRAGTITLFLLGSYLAPIDFLKISAQFSSMEDKIGGFQARVSP